MSDYIHDIFISYKRDKWGIFDGWLIDHFIPIFMFHAGNAIAEHSRRAMCSVFFDQATLSDSIRRLEGIEPGQEWQLELERAIRTSRCVVALWSPEYFLSTWCQREWQSFCLRPSKVIIPISVHDGSSFPPAAANLQYKDFSPYVISGEAFKKTAKYVTFQEEVKLLADKVGKVVATAPEFEDWPIAIDAQLTVSPADTAIPQERL